MRPRCRSLIAAALLATPTPALAENLIVQRNVTAREAPERRSDPVVFVAPGDRLHLMDEAD